MKKLIFKLIYRLHYYCNQKKWITERTHIGQHIQLHLLSKVSRNLKLRTNYFKYERGSDLFKEKKALCAYGAIIGMMYILGDFYFLIGPLRFPYQHGQHPPRYETRYNADLRKWRHYIGNHY